jgi:hypothetical protein
MKNRRFHDDCASFAQILDLPHDSFSLQGPSNIVLAKEKDLEKSILQAKFPACSGLSGRQKSGPDSFQPAIPMHPSGQLLNAKSAFK